MKIQIQHPAFNQQRLSVETTGWFDEPMLLLNGNILRKQHGFYTAIADAGTETAIRMTYNCFGRNPRIVISNHSTDLPSRIKWYELDCAVH